MLHIAEAVADEHDARVDEEADEDAGSDDLRVGILVFVQVPCAAHAQELTTVSCAIQDQNDEVENLQIDRSSASMINFASFGLFRPRRRREAVEAKNFVFRMMCKLNG